MKVERDNTRLQKESWESRQYQRLMFGPWVAFFFETVTWMLYGWAGVVELRRLIGDDPLYELGGPEHIPSLRLLIRQVSAEICPSVAGHHNSHILMSLKVDLWSP